jgi:putative FmdB family regulatory protein
MELLAFPCRALLQGGFAMPVYEYECGSCGGHFEMTRKFSDPELTECQLCKASTVRKVLSPTAFVLKGSGWYATDYAGKKADAEKPCKEEPKSSGGCAGGACASGACAAKS